MIGKNIKRNAIIIVVLLKTFVFECEAQNVAKHYKTSKFDAAIFPANSLDMIPGTRFTPTKLEIDTVEFVLAKQIKTLNTPQINQHNSPVIHENMGKYRRQYFGYLDELGHRILIINCFYKKKNNVDADWLTTKVSVLDGGSYYWTIRYDLNAKKFFDLDINGGG